MVTLKTYNIPGANMEDGAPDPSVGARILVSGEDVFIWGCGFTKPYTGGEREVVRARLRNVAVAQAPGGRYSTVF